MDGLKVPKHEKPVIQSQLYKQELNSPEERPRVKGWNKVHCALYSSVLVFYRNRESTKPLDIISLNDDFLVRKVKGAKSNSSSKKKGKRGDKKKRKCPKELFFLTDLDHINIYFGTNSPDKKKKWVQKFTQVIQGHQAKAEEFESHRKRRSSFVTMINQSQGHRRPAVDGTGLSKREMKQLDKINNKHERDLQDIELMRDTWRQEALVAKEALKEQKRKRRKDQKRLERAERRLSYFVEELDVRGHEREYQAMEAERQRQKVKKIKRRMSETDTELREYKNPYNPYIEDTSGYNTRRPSFKSRRGSSYSRDVYSDDDARYDSESSVSDEEAAYYPRVYSDSDSDSLGSVVDNMDIPLDTILDKEEELLYKQYKRRFSSDTIQYDTEDELSEASSDDSEFYD